MTLTVKREYETVIIPDYVMRGVGEPWRPRGLGRRIPRKVKKRLRAWLLLRAMEQARAGSSFRLWALSAIFGYGA